MSDRPAMPIPECPIESLAWLLAYPGDGSKLPAWVTDPGSAEGLEGIAVLCERVGIPVKRPIPGSDNGWDEALYISPWEQGDIVVMVGGWMACYPGLHAEAFAEGDWWPGSKEPVLIKSALVKLLWLLASCASVIPEEYKSGKQETVAG